VDWRDLLERPGEVELQGFAQPGSFPVVFHFTPLSHPRKAEKAEPSVLVKGTMRNMETAVNKSRKR
jgi:hypothetical protein